MTHTCSRGKNGSFSSNRVKVSRSGSGSAVPFNSTSTKSPLPLAAVRQSTTNSSRLSQQAQPAASGARLVNDEQSSVAESISASPKSFRITSVLKPYSTMSLRSERRSVVLPAPRNPVINRSGFDGCLLTEDEMALGPDRWLTHFKDPFFEWHVAMEEDVRTEEEETTIQQ